MTRLRQRCRRIGLRGAVPLLALLAVAMAPATPAAAQGWAVGYTWAYPVVFPLYSSAGACWSYGACAGPWWDERPRRRPTVPEASAAPPAQDVWSSPWGYVRRLPPPTPPSQIQPAYRDASTLRPEFAASAPPQAAP